MPMTESCGVRCDRSANCVKTVANLQRLKSYYERLLILSTSIDMCV